jgi:pyruvate,orthophosphate dikinase
VKDLQGLVKTFKKIVKKEAGREFPQDPTEQLHLAIEAVFGSWGNKRAQDYRRKNRISDTLGTAVNVQTMVFGNKGEDSGTGVAFTRNPSTGEKKPYGDYLENAQGEDVVAGIRNTLPLEDMAKVQPKAWAELLQHFAKLEEHYKDMNDIEFTVEQGKLWLLQTRIGQRTGRAMLVIADDMVGAGWLDEKEAFTSRITTGKLDEVFKKVIKSTLKSSQKPLATGLNASPGAAVGRAVFTADDAYDWANRDEPVVLIRRETNPDDFHGMIVSQGILTSAGGTSSHAALVARGAGIPAVCGADSLRIDTKKKLFTVGSTTVKEGDWITIDGTDGTVYAEGLELEDSELDAAIKGDKAAKKSDLWRAYERFDKVAESNRRMKVRANSDTPDDSENARMRGAEGIGLCRTEHMFMGERAEFVRQMIFADTEEEERAAFDALLPLQRKDFEGIFAAMDGLPVTVRLLDPPLHEFLPNHTDLSVEVALAEAGKLKMSKKKLDEQRAVLAKVNELHEANPMLGLRGVRLGIVKPGLYAMQVQAITEAAVKLKKKGKDPRPEIMIPLVSTAEELRQMREELEPVVMGILEKNKVDLHIEIGTMIELPTACISAGEIGEHADFFSFGTNDLTQTAFGFSRDDIGKFLTMYEERKLVPYNPFVTIHPAVARLMEIAVQEGKKENPKLHLGICGEHGGDPESVATCDKLGLDYVSCSPFRVPTARWAAAQAVLGAGEGVK